MTFPTDMTAELEALFDQAQTASRNGRTAESTAFYQQILTRAPEHPRALNALGNQALSARNLTAARGYFERAVARDPGASPIWLNLSGVLRMLGDDAAELAALDRALVADPYFVVALLHKAQWHERHDRADDAIAAYRSLLDAAPSLETLQPALRQALEHGKALVDARDARIEQAIRAELADTPMTSPRFDHALEVLGGRRRIYLPKPAGLHFPYLPAPQYFDRALFPWFETLEAGTQVIRDELLALGRAGDSNTPYVRIAPGTPVNQWQALNNSLDWGAIFLMRDGAEVAENATRCPGTMDILRRLPLLDIPARGPTVMFSTLRPHTRIPPHHGVTNIRAVVHLPLIVPDHCGFRVGSDTRSWQEGTAWAFDDTIEHEAWNDSDHTRVILIIDAWNPYLDDEERDLLRRANKVLGKFVG
ncbi:aspartyl/asparaginyl beta-hydroxylase domain-containing protein [Sphingomonas sp. KR1UV-12]|uniref:Aspartyl/asparaginyl beta-hydroxylase domain-containing protein n=1 Tax=Sphingomonas aurea TaxID=3063994 RepID=A0ABT9EJ19_9SPHN|nr:aspartyl/asparaginyl beta-hydroxylase domain-containing protein [Sphingomonas sp. KR1UV-12]MDP1026957.1 aspartyl/asparaginyl beta-hydroxylase domain-containing protein [Sphingomonas sp. KR1UV-12]